MSLRKLAEVTTGNTEHEVYLEVVPKANMRYLAIVTFCSSASSISGVSAALMSTSMTNALAASCAILCNSQDTLKIDTMGPHPSGTCIQINKTVAYSKVTLYEIL